MFSRWSLFPLLALMAAALLADQLLLQSGVLAIRTQAVGEWYKKWQAPFRTYANSVDLDRPQLVVIGSSRAEAIGAPFLADAVARAGLPHQVVNLGVSGGTPSLLWLGLERLTPLAERWPPGSKLVYLAAAFEFETVQTEKMATLPEGAAMLARHRAATSDNKNDEVPVGEIASPVLRALYPHSGFVQIAVKSAVLLPDWLNDLKRLRRYPAINVQKTVVQPTEAEPCGDRPVAIHPTASEAFSRMAELFGPDLVVVFAPIHPVRARCELILAERLVEALRSLRERTGFQVVPPGHEGFVLPAETWQLDLTHVFTDEGRTIVARRVVDLARGTQ